MLTLASPAKINLFLRVLRKREDGYHELASLFQAVALCDSLSFSLSESDHLTCNVPAMPTGPENLVLKAAELFRKKSGFSFGLKVDLHKNIPHEAGLGGGSGNAATTLWALNRLIGTNYNDSTLAEWSAEIGSDIPFFFSHGTAYCQGRGEHVRDLDFRPSMPVWIVKPDKGTSTPQVYRAFASTAAPVRDPAEALEGHFKGKPIYFNDLEAPACLCLPELNEIKENLLGQGFETVLLSGSGSSFFCIGGDRDPVVPSCRVFKTHTTNRTPGQWYMDKLD